MSLHKRLAYGVFVALVLTVATLAGIEYWSSFYTPGWPAVALRSVPPVNPVTPAVRFFAAQPWISEPYNSWGMRDVERTVAKPAGAAPRVPFIGDSFVESMFTPLSLPAAVERRMAEAKRPIEAINLGVGATDPRSYYYRVRDVALKLSPDAVLIFIYCGNDFVAPNAGYSMWPALVDESPGSAVVGSFMPRTNWLLVNRLRLSGLLADDPPPPDEGHLLNDWARLPAGEALTRFVGHIKRYYYPKLSEEKIRDVLSRGDGRFWRAAQDNPADQEYMFGWELNSLVNWETRDFDVAKSRDDAARLADYGEVAATLSWIEAMDEVARAHGVPLVTFLIPVGIVDPSYVDFWKVWPRAFSWNYISDVRQSKLASELAKARVRFVDLREALDGVPGTYRKLDGHWTQKGEAIVAGRVTRELEKILGQ